MMVRLSSCPSWELLLTSPVLPRAAMEAHVGVGAIKCLLGEGAPAIGRLFVCTPFSLSSPSALSKPGGEEKTAGAAAKGWRQVGQLLLPTECLVMAMGHAGSGVHSGSSRSVRCGKRWVG